MSYLQARFNFLVREHDLDDLSPLIDLDTTEMEENFNKSYLNDLIAMSDRNNQSVVAEVNEKMIRRS